MVEPAAGQFPNLYRPRGKAQTYYIPTDQELPTENGRVWWSAVAEKLSEEIAKINPPLEIVHGDVINFGEYRGVDRFVAYRTTKAEEEHLKVCWIIIS